MKPRTAVIPAAGLGTRFLPATKVVPKELLPIVDRPALEYVVDELAQSGIDEIILVIGSEKESIFEHFSMGGPVEQLLEARGKLDLLKRHRELLKKVKFRKAYQPEPKGLGHAVWCAKEEVGHRPFVVVLPDDLIRSNVPCVRQLIDVTAKEGCSAVAVERVADDAVKSYGIVAGPDMDSGKPFRVETIVEKPSPKETPSRWAIVGRYVLDPVIFSALEKIDPGAIGEIQLTDGLAELARSKGLVAVPFEGRRLDVGQPPGYLEANMIYATDRKDLAPIVRRLAREIVGEK
ncbi:MAG TPA: UTP--glucose-1-phosphate uridylyltransferase [Bdellovibrionota bacterium]|nr:UTP--glucose-1-phosphate uridylyltransferase [Bdellovibrionota bacterium]